MIPDGRASRRERNHPAGSLVPSSTLDRLVGTARGYARQAASEHTLRAYARNWAAFAEMFNPVAEDVDQVPFGVAREVNSRQEADPCVGPPGAPPLGCPGMRDRRHRSLRSLKHGPEFGHGHSLALLVTSHQVPEILADVSVAARCDLRLDLIWGCCHSAPLLRRDCLCPRSRWQQWPRMRTASL